MENSTYIRFPVKMATVWNCPTSDDIFIYIYGKGMAFAIDRKYNLNRQTFDDFHFMKDDIYLERKDENFHPDFRLDPNASVYLTDNVKKMVSETNRDLYNPYSPSGSNNLFFVDGNQLRFDSDPKAQNPMLQIDWLSQRKGPFPGKHH